MRVEGSVPLALGRRLRTPAGSPSLRRRESRPARGERAFCPRNLDLIVRARGFPPHSPRPSWPRGRAVVGRNGKRTLSTIASRGQTARGDDVAPIAPVAASS